MKKIEKWFGALILIATPILGLADHHGAGVEGAWTLTLETPRGVQHPELMVVRQGESYNGTLTGRRGEQPIEEIHVEGGHFSFKMMVSIPMGDFEMTYEGDVDGDGMTGNIGNPRGTIPFNGTRQ